MTELIARISKGSKMDQIYLPKNRTGFSSGEYVLIMPLDKKIEEKTKRFKPYFYNLKSIEPIKFRIIEETFNLIDKNISAENIILTGSFLEPGFKFNDLDILIINEKKYNTETLRNQIENLIGIKTHILFLNNKTLLSGLSSDPLYSLMLSKCISKERLIFKTKREINYKLLDLNLLKSKTLPDNYEMLNGNEKYYLTLNMVSILLFKQGKKLSKEKVNGEIKRLFEVSIKDIKENLLDKQKFIKKYKEIYNNTFNLIMKHIGKKNESK